MSTKALEAQRQLLAALFDNPEIFPEVQKLEETDFDDTKPYRRTWAALKQDILAGKQPTPASVAAKTGMTLEVVNSIPKIGYDINQIDFYVESIIAAAEKRLLNKLRSSDSLEDAERVVELAREHRMRLPSTDKCHIQAHIDQYREEFEKEKDIPLHERVVQTPFKDINNLVGGLFNGDLVVVAARPGMGKTAFIGCIIEYVLQQGFPVASFILEMTPRRIIERFAARNLGIPVSDIIMGEIDEKEVGKHYAYMTKISKYPWYIYSLREGIGEYNKFRDTFLSLYAETPFRLATVDYLQLMHHYGAGNRTQEIGHIANGFASLATEAAVPVVAASQLNRGVEAREDKHPQLSDLRESGDIEQAAALVLFLYRHGYYDPKTMHPNVAEVNAAKSRYGPTGSEELYWDGERMLFADLKKSTIY